ncbi:MAG: tape measure protein [Rhodococcus sp. (in: high G+C Gram-positive bacteria)]
MAVELATAYISLNAETSKIPGQISSAVDQGGRQADTQGRGIGSKIAAGLGGTLKLGALAAGAVAGAALSTALTQGMGRLVAIDDAKGKLAGLGHDAAGIATIMDSALASVKGTAFGLGDAATIAASAVAAGIKPGQELTKYLSLTGDAATIAGTSLEEMGSIFNKVQTSGTVFTDNLNQLSDRGIPIFQWLQDEYKVSAEELKDMVKEGKVDSATFKKVIEDNIGGAALESGKTLRGSFENMKAALGRVGEAGLKPFAKLAQDSFGGVGGFADKLAPKVEAMSTRVATGLTGMIGAFKSSGSSIEGSGTAWERFGSKVRMVTDGVQGVYSILAKGDFAGSKMTFGLDEDSKAVDILFRIREGAIAAYDGISKFFSSDTGNQVNSVLGGITTAGESASSTIGDIGSISDGVSSTFGKLADAGGSLLSSLVGLGGDTATVLAAGVEVLGSTMAFAADNADLLGVALGGVAVGMAAAQVVETGYQAARIANAIMMPAQIAAQLALVKALTAHTAALYANMVAQAPATALTLRARIAELASAAATRVRTAATVSSTSSLGAYAAAQRLAAAQSGVLGGAARNSAAGVATLGAKAAAVGTASMGALRTGAGKIASFLGGGGGFALGLAAAVTAVVAFKSSSDSMAEGLESSNQAAGKFAESMREFRSSLDEAFSSSGGQTDSGVKSVVSEQLAVIDTQLDEAAERIPGKWDKIVASVKDNPFAVIGATNLPWQNDDNRDGVQRLQDEGDAARRAQEALDSLNLTQKDLTAGVSGSQTEWLALKNALAATGDSGQYLVDKYSQVRQEILESQSSANQIRDAFGEIAQGGVGAASGVDALSSAMGRLRGDQMSVEDAQQQVNDTLRAFGEAATNAGASVIQASGQIDTSTAAGSRLYDSMKGVQSAFDQAGSSAAQSAADQKLSAADTAAAVEAAGQRVRDEFIAQAVAANIPLAEAQKLADQYRLFPSELKTNIGLTGASEAEQALDAIANKERWAKINVFADARAANDAVQGAINSGVAVRGQTFADGGFLPHQAAIEPGRGNGLVQWAEGETGGEAFIPLAPSKRGRSTAILAEVAKRFGLGLQSFANGGINDALNAARSVNGNKYSWGGTGPTNFDCSGFIGWLQQITQGIIGSTKRLYTTYSLIGGATAGLVSGLGPSGTLFQVGVSDEHMAATIDGHAVESGGAHGTSGLDDGRASAQDSQFPHKFHLPNELIAGFTEGTGATSTLGAGYSTSSTTAATWSDKNQLDLESAAVSVTQAEEARAKTEAAFAEGKKTQADLDQANLKVQKAEQRVTDLQTKKDNAANGVPDGPAPQAPALERSFDDAEVSRLTAQMAVDDANTRRNEIYADDEATANDRLKADIDLDKATKALTEAGNTALDPASGSSGPTLPGAKIAEGMRDLGQQYTGLFFDAITETFGLEKLGFIPSGDKIAEKLFSIGQPADSTTASTPSTFPKADIDKQGPVTPGAPGWLDGITALLQHGDFRGGLGVEEDNTAVGGVLGLRSLLKDSDYTSNFGDAFNTEEDNPAVDWLLKFKDKVPVFDEGGALKPGLNVVDNKTGGLEYLANVTKLMPALAQPERINSGGATSNDNRVIVNATGYSPREVVNTANRLTARRSRGAMLTGGYGR